MLLKKYQIVNLPKDAKILKTGKYGDLHIDKMTDEQAEKLFNDGSRYVALAKEVKKDSADS